MTRVRGKRTLVNAYLDASDGTPSFEGFFGPGRMPAPGRHRGNEALGFYTRLRRTESFSLRWIATLWTAPIAEPYFTYGEGYWCGKS